MPGTSGKARNGIPLPSTWQDASISLGDRSNVLQLLNAELTKEGVGGLPDLPDPHKPILLRGVAITGESHNGPNTIKELSCDGFYFPEIHFDEARFSCWVS